MPELVGSKPGRRERKKLEHRDRIVEAALKLFDLRGFDATSIANIMEEADLGTGTFYNYFKSKEDVVGFLLSDRLEKIRREIEGLLQAPGTGRDKLRKLFEIVGNSFADEQQARVVILMLYGKKLPAAGMQGHAAMFCGLMHELVQEAQKNGEFRANMDTARITSFLLGVLMYTVRQYLRSITEYRELKDAGAAGNWTNISGAAAGLQENLAEHAAMALEGISGPQHNDRSDNFGYRQRKPHQ